MAIGTSFKQECPSCEALVLVKDASMVGKKIECPKCKDKFVVKGPATEKKVEADGEDETPKKKTNGKPVPAKNPAQRVAGVEDKREKPQKGPGKGKTKTKADDDEEEDDKGKKKKAGTSRFTMGIALAVVGMIVLGTAAYFILFSKGTTNAPVAKGPKGVSPTPVLPDTSPKEEKDGNDKELVKDVGTKPRPLDLSIGELTNLLPNDTDHVAHVPLQVVFDRASQFSGAMFQTSGGLNDDLLRDKLGFSLLDIHDLLRADHYGAGGWSFTVVYFKEIINQDAVKKALALKPAPLVKNHTHYQVTAANPWFEQLARFAIGVPRQLRALPKRDNRALYVHFHNPQTLIFADEAPMVALLKVDKRFKTLTDTPAPADGATENPVAQPQEQPPVKSEQTPVRPRPKRNQPLVPAPPKDPTPPTEPKEPTENDPNAPPAPPARVEAYLTIKPALKAILDRLEPFGVESKDQVLFSSATDLEAARFTGAVPDKGKFLWNPRQVWDVTLLLQERNPRVRFLGVALALKEDGTFHLRNELQCPLENDARALNQELSEDIAPDVGRFIERLLAHKVELPKKEEPMPVDPVNPRGPVSGPRIGPRIRPVDPNNPPKEKKEDPSASKITVAQKEKNVEFVLDLKLTASELGKLHGIASLIGCGVRAEMDVAAGATTRHDLASAVKILPEKGLSERGVAPGNYPPGAFHRKAVKGNRFIHEPSQRVSWMAGLLPFLNQDTLYSKINFNDSWHDPTNWLAAGTLVPQFIDPSYPARSHFLARPDLPFEPAATHYVGIAGIGLDAADYDPADPATITKRGVMGYDKGISLEVVRKGHGLANTIVMVQVPPDSITGSTPWMAGGGSTLRGVPEKNSAAPFVFSSPGQDNKPRRGTYAVMADGSVRFIDQNVSDEVFKAMATAQSPLPDDFDPDSTDSKTPLVRPLKGLEVKKGPMPTKPSVPPVQKSLEKKQK